MRFVRSGLALVALALVASACGGAARAGSNGSEETADDQLVAFTNCMREHGVDVEAESDDQGRMRVSIGGPRSGGSGSEGGSGNKPTEPDPEIEEAMRACEDKLPNKGQDLTPEERAELEDQLLEFAQCMREHGIDMPDPGEGGFIQKFSGSDGDSDEDSNFSGPDPESPEFRAAEEACKDKLPNRMGGPSVNREEAN